MKSYLFIVCLASLIMACNFKQTSAQEGPLKFIPYYTEEMGYNGIKFFEHYVFLNKCDQVNDSILLEYAKKYKLSVKTDTPIASITFITDTSSFPKNYDNQHWDKIRTSFCRDIFFEIRPGNNYSRINEIGYWKNGERYKDSIISNVSSR